MARVLLTGGTGFIGRNLVAALSVRHEVLAPTRAEMNLLDEEAVERFLAAQAVEVVVHGAVQPGHRNSKDPSQQVYRNCRMFFNLVRALQPHQRMILIGSGAVYDQRHCPPKVRETDFDSHVPEDDHGFSKYLMAKYIERSEAVTELRLFGVFGPHEDYAIRFISNAICKALFDLPITLRQNRRFDYLWVKDLPAILDHFVAGPGRHPAYNVTPDVSLELLSLAENVRAITGRQVPIRVAQDGMGPEYTGDNSRLREEIPGLRFTPIEAAIEELTAWYVERRHELNREALLLDK